MSFNFARYFNVALGLLCIVLTSTAVVSKAHSGEAAPIFSHGAGPYELIIFSDYFCSPCRKLEKEMGKTISTLIDRGGVRVTFVDMPLFKLTPLYARYFLYAINAAPTYRDALKARQFLFEKASRLGAITEAHLERDFSLEGIAVKPYDTQSSLAKYSEMIKKYKVHSTPTFVFVYSSTDIRKYSGNEPIQEGMKEFLKALDKL